MIGTPGSWGTCLMVISGSSRWKSVACGGIVVAEHGGEPASVVDWRGGSAAIFQSRGNGSGWTTLPLLDLRRSKRQRGSGSYRYVERTTVRCAIVSAASSTCRKLRGRPKWWFQAGASQGVAILRTNCLEKCAFGNGPIAVESFKAAVFFKTHGSLHA